MNQTNQINQMNQILNLIHTRQATVAVIGLGYVGLPLAREFLKAGFPVLGFDIDKGKIQMLERGESYIKHVDGEFLREKVKS